MCMIVGDQKAQVLWMECSCNRLAKMTKELGCRGIKTSLEQRICYSRATAIL